MRHTYPPYRAGYWHDEPVNVMLPAVLYSAVCPRCLQTIVGPLSGLTVTTETQGDRAVKHILSNHVCIEIVGPS